MNRIYIEITRNNNEIDCYRFEPNDLADDYHKRAWNFLDNQLSDCKVWVMKNIPTLRIEQYDLIED